MKRVSESVGQKPVVHVRYEGFEPIENGRRLRLRVKLSGQAAFEVTCDVSDAAFISAARLTIQDAAPMAYEKLVALLAQEHSMAPTTLSLTAADVSDYIRRHQSHKDRRFTSEYTAPANVAA
jgi:hypothetical protein